MGELRKSPSSLLEQTLFPPEGTPEGESIRKEAALKEGWSNIPMEDPNKAIGSIASIVQATAWPLLVLYMFISFHEPAAKFIERATRASVKVPGGGELTLEQVAASAAAVGTAAGKQNEASQRVVDNISQIFKENKGRSLSDGRIRCVDDNPSNNILLINSLQELGVRVLQAASTEQAEQILRQGRFDVVISDMSRPPDEEAGKTLLNWMKTQNIKIPVIIYAARWAQEHQGQEMSIGALRITNDPSVVYHLALRAIQGL